MKKTLIIGASNKPERYSYKATEMLKEYNNEVQLLAKRESKVLGEEIRKKWSELDLRGVHTVTLYLSSKYQEEYYEDLISLRPERVIFNPGTENKEFYKMLNSAQIPYLEACTLVLLRSNQY